MVGPKLTVLMPVYNGALFLREAIESILRQTLYAFEFLIIDDGSTDETIDIISSFTDERIRLLRNPTNLGISATLNRGIEASACDLIARMDADDIAYPDRLAKLYEYMCAYPQCVLVSSWARVITADRNFVRLERYRSEYYYYNLTFECWIYHPTVMFRREAVVKVGMYSMPYSEDYDLFWKLSTQYLIGNIEEPLLDYRLSPISLNTVLRKDEYDIANEQNVLRNIRYYMGDDFVISKPVLECLRHNFQPIITSGRISEAIEALRVLELITDRIKNVKNPNCNSQEIDEAHFYKKQFIVRELSKAFSSIRALTFLTRTRSWDDLSQLSRSFILRRYRNLKLLMKSWSLC